MPVRILIVDDKQAILATMAPMLQSPSFEVLTAMSGAAALEAVERANPDLMILDLGLPGPLSSRGSEHARPGRARDANHRRLGARGGGGKSRCARCRRR